MLERYLALGVFVAGCSAEISGQPEGMAGTTGGGSSLPGGGMSSGPLPPGTAGPAAGGAVGQPGGAGAPGASGSGAVTPPGGGAVGVGGSPVLDPKADYGVPVGGPRIARLTHFQWSNSVQDLLQLPSPPPEVEEFTPDAIIGYDTNSDQLRMSGTLREDYERAAEAVAARVVADPAALARLIPADAPTETTARATAFIKSFGLKAYRRPLSQQEIDQVSSLFQQAPSLLPDLDPFAAGVMLSIRLFLQSPHFLYRTELGVEPVNGQIALNGYEVAAKLALAITGSTPDDTLLAAAASGALDPGKSQATIDSEAQRLLATARGKASALHLQAQALALARFGLVKKDPALYPEFKPSTPASLLKSAELFLGALYDENLGVRALLSSTEAFVDANLAPLYGLTQPFGAEFQRVDLSGLPRRGFLTQPGLMALFAGENEPDPIHRGVFINEQILCVKIGPPAANIPPLPEAKENETNRQRIDALTGPGTCGAGCHATIINPIGFAFENYDPIGRYRTTDGGVTVDASGSYPLDGQMVAFKDAVELSQLLADSQAVHRCAASHWLAYLYGRLPTTTDATALDALAQRSDAENLSSKDMIRSLVKSQAFLNRAAVVQ